MTSGTASQEVNFWLSMEKELERIDAQLKGDGVGTCCWLAGWLAGWLE